MTALLFCAATAAGAVIRWRVAARFRTAGTVAVNVFGAFTLAVLAASDVSGVMLTIIGAGGLGALTTVSGWIAEIENRWRSQAHLAAAALLFGTLAAGTVAAWLGLQV